MRSSKWHRDKRPYRLQSEKGNDAARVVGQPGNRPPGLSGGRRSAFNRAPPLLQPTVPDYQGGDESLCRGKRGSSQHSQTIPKDTRVSTQRCQYKGGGGEKPEGCALKVRNVRKLRPPTCLTFLTFKNGGVLFLPPPG